MDISELIDILNEERMYVGNDTDVLVNGREILDVYYDNVDDVIIIEV